METTSSKLSFGDRKEQEEDELALSAMETSSYLAYCPKSLTRRKTNSH